MSSALRSVRPLALALTYATINRIFNVDVEDARSASRTPGLTGSVPPFASGMTLRMPAAMKPRREGPHNQGDLRLICGLYDYGVGIQDNLGSTPWLQR